MRTLVRVSLSSVQAQCFSAEEGKIMIVDGGNSAAYTADDGSFALNVSRTGRADREYGKPAWRYAVYVDGSLLTSGEDLHGWGDAVEMLGTLVSFLGNDADRYRTRMGPVDPGDDDYTFGENVAEWAYSVSDELGYADAELEELSE